MCAVSASCFAASVSRCAAGTASAALASAADAFGRGVDDTGFKPHGAREVRQAAHAFLSMKSRIQRHIEQRTALLASVSHDLRTPLTSFQLSLELLRQTELAVLWYVGRARREVERALRAGARRRRRGRRSVPGLGAEHGGVHGLPVTKRCE